MGSISSGTGLVSGINTDEIIKQLLQVEARPRQLVEKRVGVLQSRKSAFLDVNARLLGLKSSAKELADPSLFSTKSASSSNESVLTASARNRAAEGNYSIAVDRLVSTQQLLTRGFADTDSTTLDATTVKLESHRARLDGDVELASLNGQNGVQRGTIRITDRSGDTADVDLSKAVNLDDVISAINEKAGIGVTASMEGDGLKLTDNTGSTANDLAVQDLGTTSTAADLGLAGNSGGADTLTGSSINTLGTATPLDALNDGNGVRKLGAGQDDLAITLRNGSTVNVNLAETSSVGDVIEKINTAGGGDLNASIGPDGTGLRLTDNTAGGSTFSVAAANGSKAGEDLGLIGSDGNGDGVIDGERVLAALGSKLLKNLNGGSGVNAGTVDITNRAGNTTSIDLSGAASVSDVIDTINGAGAGVTAALNDAGNGLKLEDTTGSTSSNLIVADNSGSLAGDLGLATDPGGVGKSTLNGGDRDLQYISENTRLDALNNGNGIAQGRFTITDSEGVTSTVDLTQGNETTLNDVIKEINSRPTDITASINDTGDGLVLTDNAGGGVRMRVAEEGSTTAADLGILGEDEDDDGTIDGSFETSIAVEATDTLDDLKTKINEAGGPATASIVNDGSGANPYRLNITSRESGAQGRVMFDDGGLNLQADTLVEGRDAVAFLGSSDPTQALMITSPTNTLDDTIDGLDVELHSPSNQAVELSVARDDQGLVDAVQSSVDDFNSVMSTIEKYDKYDEENEERGLLLGDSTVAQIRRRLFNLVQSRIDGAGGRFDHPSQLGLTVGGGSRMEFDAEKFREALNTDPEAVKSFFTAMSTQTEDVDLPPGVSVPSESEETDVPVGFGAQLNELSDQLTNSLNGLITNKTESIDNQIELNRERIESINSQLTAKRDRLRAEFSQMETALAQLESQQQALSRISSGGGGGGSGFASLAGAFG